MKLIIAGSRSVYPTPSEIDAALDVLVSDLGADVSAESVTMVVSGRAPGADTAGEAWAELRRVPVAPFPITKDDKKEFGYKLAPKMRNRRMAEYGDIALVFWDGISGGSSDMVTRMVARNKPVRVVPSPRRK